MKHISEMIAARRDQIERSFQLSLFSRTAREKGSREWSLFNPIAHDRVDAYRVTTPRRRPQLRYPNIVPIHRYPRHLTVTLAR